MIDADPDRTDAALDRDADYRALFDAIDDGFAVIQLITDADGRTVDVLHVDANPAYERHTGIHGIVGKRASEVGLERGPWYDAYTEVARTGAAVRIEAHIAAIDRSFSAHVSRIGGDGSRTLAVVFHDITDRKRVEATLRENEARYRLLFEGIDEGFCLCERVPSEPIDYRFLAANPAFERQSGLHDPVGRTMRELVPMVEDSIMERYRQVEDSGESARFESHVAQLDRWFEIEVAPADAPRQIAILFRDITMRQKAATVLRDSEERQKFLLTLTDTLRPLSDAGEIERQATRLLGEYLQADRCFLSPVYDDGSGMCVREEYLRSGASSVLGNYTFAQFGDFVGPTLHAGHVLAVENIAELTGLSADERASYAATEIAAYLLVPVTREGRLAAFLTINHRTPRAWSDADKAVARQTADRLWTARERTLAETALHESEAERRSLIAEMNEGFCILEVILDEAGIGVDYRFLETNPAFVRQGGFDPAGRLMSEIAPIEPVWPAAYGRVATTGVPERIVDAAAAFGRTYDVYAFRVGDPDDHRIAVFFTDITTRKRAEEALRDSEERQTFLLKLSDALRPIRDATAIQQVAVRLLGEHLGVNRAGYYEVGPDQNTFYLTAGWERGLPPLPDRMLITDFGDEIREGYLAGRTMAASDTEQEAASDDNLAAVRTIAVRAWIGVPLVKDGRWVAAAGVHSAVPRDWTPAELRLVEDVAERIWAAAERARVELALRDTQEQQRLMLQLVPVLLWSTDPAGRKIALNERWTNFTGQTDAETQDFGWLDAIHPDDLPATQAAFAHASATGEPIEREHRIHLAGDGYRWHLVRHVPVRDDRGEIVRWFGAAIDIHELRRLQDLQETLLAELQHRVRNILAVIRSMMRRSSETQESLADYVQHLEGRISALARTQVLLTRSVDARVDLEDLIRDELLAQAADETKISLLGPPVTLGPKAAEVLSLAVHELATNAVKYGALLRVSATLQVSWQVEERANAPWLRFTWSEFGVAVASSAPRREGFGSELITRRVPYELKGKGLLEMRPGGIVCELEFPLKDRASILQTDARTGEIVDSK